MKVAIAGGKIIKFSSDDDDGRRRLCRERLCRYHRQWFGQEEEKTRLPKKQPKTSQDGFREPRNELKWLKIKSGSGDLLDASGLAWAEK